MKIDNGQTIRLHTEDGTKTAQIEKAQNGVVIRTQDNTPPTVLEEDHLRQNIVSRTTDGRVKSLIR
jgi:hypothetical protein